MSFETTALLLAWIAIVTLAFGMAGLLRQVQALRAGRGLGRATVGPPIGSLAPAFRTPDVQSSGTRILIFSDTACPTCEVILPEFARLAEGHEESDLKFVAAFANGKTELDGSGVLVLGEEEEAFRHYRVPATPFGVIVARDGTIVDTRPVGSVDALRQFVRRAELLAEDSHDR